MYEITDLSFWTEDEQFATRQAAIDYIWSNLASDDRAYGVLNVNEEQYECIVFQGEIWRVVGLRREEGE